jgi:hypothetical protein
MTLSREDVWRAKEFIEARAAGATPRVPCHWIRGGGHLGGNDYCRSCCEKEVARLRAQKPDEIEHIGVDGGFDIDHDSPPFCTTCHAPLTGSITDGGAVQEFEALFGDAEPTMEDREGWFYLKLATDTLLNTDKRWERVVRLIGRAWRCETKATSADVGEAAGA